jgi:quercetin dioxygenase-like cupin family protein
MTIMRVKNIKLKKGHRYSLQYHEEKLETQYVYSGLVKMTYGTDSENLKEIVLKPGDKFDVNPYTIHRAEALEDSKIFEVSTPHLTDVVKLHDDYGRSGKGNNERLDQKLHEQNQ